MLEEIKKELLNHPDKLKEVLEHFGFCNIVIRPNYLQFGRSKGSSRKSIVIRTDKNKYLYVTDYARNINADLFSYIMEQKNVSFADILNVIKGKLGISDYYDFFEHKGIFGGFYDKIRKHNTTQVRTYDESILNEYMACGNLRFLKDNISLESQRFFNIRYDIESQGIVIPIYNQLGQLMGVKVRCNYDVGDGEQKYYYLVPCAASQTLYGYSQNYNSLAKGTILIGEAEKFVLQCYTYGIRNCVGLGSGTISKKQIQMLFELNPRRIFFMHDVGYELDKIMRNIKMVQQYSRFKEVELGYWDYFNKGYPDKKSPTDFGKEIFNKILSSEITMIGDEQI